MASKWPVGGQWEAGEGVAPLFPMGAVRFSGQWGRRWHRWPVGEAVAKGGQSAKGRLPGGAVSGAPLLAREWPAPQ